MSSTQPRESQIGIIGVGVMGSNLALLFAEHNFEVSIWDKKQSSCEDTHQKVTQQGRGQWKLKAHAKLSDMVRSLTPPRRLLISISHGHPVDEVLDELLPLVNAGDVVVDCGNEWWQETERRQKRWNTATGGYWMGMGVSGGWKGARFGPSCSIAGDSRGWELLQPMFAKVVAHCSVDQTPALAYLGEGGSGHYVKMVHNGIEQAMMSSITEVFDLLTRVGKCNEQQLHEVFSQWNDGDLQSYLMDITKDIVIIKDPQDTTHYLLPAVNDEVVQDEDSSEGTGVWTAKEGPEQHVPSPGIDSALFYRLISAIKQERVRIARLYQETHQCDHTGSSVPSYLPSLSQAELINLCRDALYISYLLSFVQGFAIIAKSKEHHKWSFPIEQVLGIYKSGCIIQAKMIFDLHAAYEAQPNMTMALESPSLVKLVTKDKHTSLRKCVLIGIAHSLPMPVLASNLSYLDAYLTTDLPLNLMEAQLDYFGAHHFYRKNDGQSGKTYHVDWEQLLKRQQENQDHAL